MKKDKSATPSAKAGRSKPGAAEPTKAKPARTKSPKLATKAGKLADTLRESVFATIPAATWTLVRQVDPALTYAEIVRLFAEDPLAGVDSRGAAIAMQRACAEQGLDSWCYEYGDPDRFTHTAVLVREGSVVRLHDPLLNLASRGDLFAITPESASDVLQCGKGRRPYRIDPDFEDPAAIALFESEDTVRGATVMVPGGEALLAATSPAFRQLVFGAQGLAALIRKPVALLDPAGSGSDIAARLGLVEPQGATAQPPAPGLFSATGGASGRMALEQLGSLVEQANAERSSLLDRLLAAQERSAELTTELAVARTRLEFAETRCSDLAERLVQAVQAGDRAIGEAGQLRRDLASAEQERNHSVEELARTNARLAQIRAEVEDSRQESQRLGDALAASEAARATLEAQRNEALAALEASERAYQQAVRGNTGSTGGSEQSGAEAEPLPGRSLLQLVTPGGKATIRPDGAIAMQGGGKGCLCYGPYIDLPAGCYRLELDLLRQGPTSLLPAEALIEIVDGSRYLFSSRARLGRGHNRFGFDFEVPETNQIRQIEFRIIAGSRAYAALVDLRLIG